MLLYLICSTNHKLWNKFSLFKNKSKMHSKICFFFRNQLIWRSLRLQREIIIRFKYFKHEIFRWRLRFHISYHLIIFNIVLIIIRNYSHSWNHEFIIRNLIFKIERYYNCVFYFCICQKNILYFMHEEQDWWYFISFLIVIVNLISYMKKCELD